jgi:hypothetical protein
MVHVVNLTVVLHNFLRARFCNFNICNMEVNCISSEKIRDRVPGLLTCTVTVALHIAGTGAIVVVCI